MDIDMEVEDAAEPTPSIPTDPKVLWSNPNARTSAKSTRRGRRNMQKLRRNGGAPQPSQDSPYHNVNGSTDTTSSFATIPDIILTSATPGQSSALPPLTASNTATGHLKPPPFIPHPSRSRRRRAKANVSAKAMRPLTDPEIYERSERLDRLHQRLGHQESYVERLEQWVISRVAEEPSLGPDFRSEQLANARAEAQSYRAAIENMVSARHFRPMTEKEKVQNERLVELHHKCYIWDKYEKEVEEWMRKHTKDLEEAWSIWEGQKDRACRTKKEFWDEIFEIKREWGFDSQNSEMPVDPANGIFSTKMLRESRWSREEKYACAQHYVAAWEIELGIWEERKSTSGGSDWDQELVERSICKAWDYLGHFASKVDEFSDPNRKEKQEVVDGEDKIEEQREHPTEMDERMSKLVEGVKGL